MVGEIKKSIFSCFTCCKPPKKKQLVRFKVVDVAKRVPGPQLVAVKQRPIHRKLVSTEVIDITQILKEK